MITSCPAERQSAMDMLHFIHERRVDGLFLSDRSHGNVRFAVRIPVSRETKRQRAGDVRQEQHMENVDREVQAKRTYPQSAPALPVLLRQPSWLKKERLERPPDLAVEVGEIVNGVVQQMPHREVAVV